MSFDPHFNPARRDERIENAIQAFADAQTAAEKQAAFNGLCEWVADGRDAADPRDDAKEARALLAARGLRTTRRYA